MEKHLEEIEELDLDGNNALPFVSQLATKVEGRDKEYEVRPVLGGDEEDVKTVIGTVDGDMIPLEDGGVSSDNDEDFEFD